MLKKFFLNISLTFCLLSQARIAIAEIIPDNTLPINSTVIYEDNIKVIEGGTIAENNLFHSFTDFSITSVDTAYFNNLASVHNIITRITGGKISNIDGSIKANGNANLFMINPAGIIFGSNASLDIGGSFIATTANSIKFADGSEFIANANPVPSLLIVSVPMGLQFGSNTPGRIINQSQASPNGELTDATPPNPIGLKVPIGKTLALVGGDVTLDGGNLTTTGGRIEIASIANTGLVKLTEIDKGYTFDYSGIQNFANLQLLQGAIIYGSGNSDGDIKIQAGNLNITESSAIFSNTLDAEKGGNIEINVSNLTADQGSFIGTFVQASGDAGEIIINASDSIKILGTTIEGEFPTAIVSQVTETGTGKGGNIIIHTNQLLIGDGAIVDASTFGAGSAGNVIITASDSIELIRSSDIRVPSGIFAQVADIMTDKAGNAGSITIETKRLVVLNGAQILTSARRDGNGGTLLINATDAIILSGTSPFATGTFDDDQRSGIFVSAEPEATGNVGSFTLNTGILIVENGARISADNFGSGQATTQNINVRQLLIRNGGEVRVGSFNVGAAGTLNIQATESLDIIGSTTINSNTVVSTLFSQAEASGQAGNLNISTPQLNVRDNGVITVSGTGNATAGNLTINSNTIRLNRGNIKAETNTGAGANIILKDINLLILENQSLISATAFNNANGGNIDIDASEGFIVVIPDENSDITANAFAGKGGNIQISTKGIFGIEARSGLTDKSDITASSTLGIQGFITINAPENDAIKNSLTELPNNLIDTNALIANSCIARNPKKEGSFIITGNSGLPTRPGEAMASSYSTGDVQNVSNNSTASSWKKGDPIVEPHGVYRLENGELVMSRECP
ncbi:filamentous hemagglutinin N-terminal domain-containing protein [Nostoc sp. TCL26-01]|uniref:two-partner secretion domain-containing protein n=1 Tax=Nostoc sp. TCL26-01 TaxID=2576904 RepID=UPI0015BC3461|nr:filamentous hemagglutinin N-terminal domain-containing protein [Nostoc sp. TCL26-01]QLE54312.1 filamentous hemagglutinin N-terminal domain-containing protein [Nostoc sp. TCL26-01]